MRVLRAMPVLTVDDLDSAIAAYTAVTGMQVVMNHGWIATLSPADGDRSAQLSLMTQDATASVNPVTSIEVDDVDAAYRSALDCGLEIAHELTDEAWGVRRFFYRDASGNVINVLSHL